MEEQNNKLRWGILATGSIAGSFAEGVLNSKSGQLVLLVVGPRIHDSLP